MSGELGAMSQEFRVRSAEKRAGGVLYEEVLREEKFSL